MFDDRTKWRKLTATASEQPPLFVCLGRIRETYSNDFKCITQL